MTHQELITAVANLSLPGVGNLGHPPLSLNDADLPIKWVQFPSGEAGVLTFTSAVWRRTIRLQAVVALQPVAQGQMGENFQSAVAMMDSLGEGLQRLNVLNRISLRVAIVTVAQTDYWAVIADLEA